MRRRLGIRFVKKELKINLKTLVRVLILLSSIVIIIILSLCKSTKTSLFKYIGSTDTVNQYLNLFNTAAKNNMRFVISYSNDQKNPIAKYIYMKNYCLLVYSVNLSTAVDADNLSKIIQKDTSSISTKSNWVSDDLLIKNRYYFFRFSNNTFNNIDCIKFVLEGSDIVKRIVDSNRVVFNLFINKLYIRYNDQMPFDIMFNRKTDDLSLNFNIEFYRKNEKIYIIIMYPNNDQHYKVDKVSLNELLNE